MNENLTRLRKQILDHQIASYRGARGPLESAQSALEIRDAAAALVRLSDPGLTV